MCFANFFAILETYPRKSLATFQKEGNTNPACNYMFEVNNRNTRARCEICSKLTIKTPERCHWHRSGVFIVNFEYI